MRRFDPRNGWGIAIAVSAVGFLLWLPHIEGLRQVGIAMMVGGGVAVAGFQLYLTGFGWTHKRWNAPREARRARYRGSVEGPPRESPERERPPSQTGS